MPVSYTHLDVYKRQELEHVRQYLYIQKERYEEKLNYVIDAPGNLLDYTVPKIILQPIVENSIYQDRKSVV